MARPGYDRAAAPVGVVHFGPGAFFRAHVASYLERALEAGAPLAVCAASLRSGAVERALTPQDGLYTLVELDREPRMRVVGAVREIVSAEGGGADRLRRRLLDPAVRLVTLTVTEKGYTLRADGELDLDHPDVRHDLAHPEAVPRSVTAWIADALAARRAAGAAPFVTLSCDNLADNGVKLGRAVAAFSRARGAEAPAEACFPRTMVDSITPATDDVLRARVRRALGGVEDAWPVQREPFTQWVIEDALGEATGLREALAAAGATVTADVAPFARAKLRLLNGAHSTLAYVGLLAGRETVADAMAEPRLAAFVERLMRGPIAATLPSAANLDVPAYIGAVLARFRNPAVRHELEQIAWDGSQKLPVRLLATAADALAAAASVETLAVPVAAWMRFVRLRVIRGEPLIDPLAAPLAAEVGDDGPAEAERFLALEAVFPPAMAGDARFRAAVLASHAALGRDPLRLP